MKLAVACKHECVSDHFGHCTHFHVYDIEDEVIVSKKVLANPGHQPGTLPKYLHDLGVNLIISGGMGGKAIDLFQSLNISVIVGANGHVDEVVIAFLRGGLTSTNEACGHTHDDSAQTHTCVS